MDYESQATEAAAVASLTTASLAVQHADADGKSSPFVLLPEGYRVQDLETSLGAPLRKRGTVYVDDRLSFVAIVKAQKSGSTVLYRQINPPKFEAVFNDDGESAGWGDHRAVYQCPLSFEWQRWTAKTGHQMNQAQFAFFIEDNLPDIIDPPGADMLEISRTLVAKKTTNFASAVRLDNGQVQFVYEEKIEGKSGARGQLQIPEVFSLGLAVFENGERYAAVARLRYRIEGSGDLKLWYDLERPHKIIEGAVAELTEKIEAEVGLVSVNGRRDNT